MVKAITYQKVDRVSPPLNKQNWDITDTILNHKLFEQRIQEYMS